QQNCSGHGRSRASPVHRWSPPIVLFALVPERTGAFGAPAGLVNSSSVLPSWQAFSVRRSVVPRISGDGRLLAFPLGSGDVLLDREEAVGADRDRIDAVLDQKARDLRVIARRLAADPGLRPGAPGFDEKLRDRRLDRLVALVEQALQAVAVPIDAKHQLG